MNRIRITLYVISATLALIGFPSILFLLYMELITVSITSKFLWVISGACCILSILSFSLGHILTTWEEEDNELG